MQPNKSNKISRKSFLSIGSTCAAITLTSPFSILSLGRQSVPAINEITILPVAGEFYRPIAMNAYDDTPKGKSGSTKLVRVILNDGTEGIGIEGYRRVDEETVKGLQKFIGVNLEDIYKWQNSQIIGFSDKYRSFFQNPKFAFFESSILDALGRVKNKPVWQLFSSKVRSVVDCYDGTLYFKDIELDTDASVIGDLAKRIQEDGYKAIKMKVGRPYKWLKGEKGVARDIEAVKVAREAVGSNFNLMVDANNGYQKQFDWALRFLRGCAPYEMYWMEEVFPESKGAYNKLYSALSHSNTPVYIAEGENVNKVEEFRPYLEAGLYHYIQPDMRTVGFSNILRAADMADHNGAALVPHNWQSEVGKIMSVHAAMIRKNITFAEDDRYHNLALDASSYLFRDGQWIPPKKPGWGIDLNNYNYFKSKTEEQVIS